MSKEEEESDSIDWIRNKPDIVSFVEWDNQDLLPSE